MDEVQAYYDGLGEREWSRLETPNGSLEYAVNRHFIEHHLPRDAYVLDIGGGPGRYAIWLAELGHRVVLADPSAELLAIAEQRVASSPHGSGVEAILQEDARDLSTWGDGEFDAALCLGPFYHLSEPDDREQAAAELHRVVRPAGIIFAAFMPRYTFLRRTAVLEAERRHLREPVFVERLVRDGVFLNDEAGRFTGGYGAVPSEIEPFFDRHGFDSVGLIASEGLGAGIEESVSLLARHDPVAHDRLMDLIINSAADPALHGLTNHLLYVGVRKPG